MHTDVRPFHMSFPAPTDSVPRQESEKRKAEAKSKIDALVADIHRVQQDAANSGLIDKEKYIIPPHLHDLQESDLPETQRGLVISEIAQFRERAAKREREKLRDVQASIPALIPTLLPQGPKAREWGKGQAAQGQPGGKAGSKGPQGFVKGGDENASASPVSAGPVAKTDEELEAERKEARRREEENSFKDVSCAFDSAPRTVTDMH